MKHTITNRIATLLLLAVGLAGCSKEETLPSTPDATRSPMSITVADSGYASTDKLHTRATDNGYATTFTEGDQIGLYIVKPDGNTYAAQNLCLTLTDTGGGTLAWQAPTDTEPNYEGATAKYFAYYPFQATLNGTPVSTATTATDFFAPVASAWTPATDQSAYTTYTASDLMTGIGTVGNSKQPDGSYPLSFTMTHAMALVMIEVPSITHTIVDAGGIVLSTYDSSNVEFLGFMPYSLAGIYRYLVKPSQSAATNLVGSYLAANGKFQEFTLQQNSINAASYTYYRVDGGSVIFKKHTLQVGDFYLKDGSLVNKDALLSDDQKANCIGIVYWLGNIKSDNYGLLDKKFPSGTRGLVACNQLLTSHSQGNDGNQQTMTWCYSESEFVKNFNWVGKPTGFILPTNDKMQGYINTVHLQKYNTKIGAPFLYAKAVLPIAALATFVTSNPAPTSSSDWYWPSDLELTTMCWGQGNTTRSLAGRNMLNTQFDKVGGQRFELLSSTQYQNDSFTYWASTESWTDATQANVVDFSSGESRVSSKPSHEHPVRPILAF